MTNKSRNESTLIQGDCLEKMRELDNSSVDAVIMDPPYGLGFMGKEWDKLPPGKEVFKECLRVLKPGGHLLSFGGTRTYHRMAVAIEDAGFEIRDMLEWIYASGFPKSHNVGKAYDKKMGNEREDLGEIIRGDVQKAKEKGSGYLADPANRNNVKQFGYGKETLTKGNSKWEGFGTALKPAHEPIVLARKPLSEKTIVENCIKHGTGVLDIDGCRIPFRGQDDWDNTLKSNTGNIAGGTFKCSSKSMSKEEVINQKGRFPANLLVTDDALNDNQNVGYGKSGKPYSYKGKNYKVDGFIKNNSPQAPSNYADSGSKSRYFDIDVWGEKHGLIQTPKASKKERNMGCEGLEYKRHSDRKKDDGAGGDNPRNRTNTPKKNFHPTVKPLRLMAWLVRLVSKEGDTVLDPFMGSGTTGVACKKLKRNFIGIEISKDYYKIAEARINKIQSSLL